MNKDKNKYNYFAMDKDKLYQHEPEPQEWDVDQSLFDHIPVKQGENSVGYLYNNKQQNLQPEDYDDLYNNAQNVRHTKVRETKKTTNSVLTASAILIASVVGVVTIVNPLTMRPKVQNDSYSLENNVLKYALEVSNRLSYDCDLVLYKNSEEIDRKSVDNSQSYEGEYIINESGDYEFKFVSTNNVDYKNSVTLYTFTYSLED